MVGRGGPAAHRLGLPMVLVPPGHLEMRKKHQHTIQRPPPPGWSTLGSFLTVILPSAWVARPSPGGRRTGSSVFTQAESQLISTVSPCPNQALQGFCGMCSVWGHPAADNPCPSRIFSAVFCTRGLFPQPSVFSSEPRLSSPRSRACGGLTNQRRLPGHPGSSPRHGLLSCEQPAVQFLQAAPVTAG